jgi:hypothetical protein
MKKKIKWLLLNLCFATNTYIILDLTDSDLEKYNDLLCQESSELIPDKIIEKLEKHYTSSEDIYAKFLFYRKLVSYYDKIGRESLAYKYCKKAVSAEAIDYFSSIKLNFSKVDIAFKWFSPGMLPSAQALEFYKFTLVASIKYNRMDWVESIIRSNQNFLVVKIAEKYKGNNNYLYDYFLKLKKGEVFDGNDFLLECTFWSQVNLNSREGIDFVQNKIRLKNAKTMFRVKPLSL